MAALFTALHTNQSDKKYHYTPARTSSDESSSSGLLEKDTVPQFATVKKRPFLLRYAPLILAHIFIFLLYLFLLYGVSSSYATSRRLNGPGIINSPAREAIHYEDHTFILGDRIQEYGIYSGRPSPELDLAWHNLLNNENIRLPTSLIEHLGRSDIAVAMPDGSGYIGTLNLYHELHCIKRLHQALYPAYYYPSITPEERELNRLHAEHCIDFLRQSAMCHGDIGPITFVWTEDSRLPVANATSHECVNWERLEGWMQEKTVDMFALGLRHPSKGGVYEGE